MDFWVTIGGVLSKKENWIWAIPTGIVGGAMVGCQVDGVDETTTTIQILNSKPVSDGFLVGKN